MGKKDVTIHNRAAFDELLKSPEVEGEIRKLIGRARSSAGPEYMSNVGIGRTRVLGMVWPATARGRALERREHRLMRAMDEFRGGGGG